METKLFDIVTDTATKPWLSGIAKYKNMRKFMVEFLRKFENRAVELLELTWFESPNQSIYFNFEQYWGVRCYVDILKLTASFPSINREVYG